MRFVRAYEAVSGEPSRTVNAVGAGRTAHASQGAAAGMP